MRRGTVVGMVMVLALLLAMPLLAQEQKMDDKKEEMKSMVQKMQGAQFVKFPGLPDCTSGAVYSGDPGKGDSLLMVKATKGCLIPWHWHTPSEFVMMTGGSAKVEMKDGAAQTIGANDYVSFPSKHQHQFTCTKDCTLFLYTDAKFDIHYVDKDGNEIPPEKALAGEGKAGMK